jgi:hypothetical protein
MPAMIDERIDRLDLTLFDPIPSQSSAGDRRAWLAVIRAVRRRGSYTYLEIGSHLGGSLQHVLVDPACRRIYSIDARPLVQPDERGGLFSYQDNSTERMLENLRAIDASAVAKVRTFDSDASAIDPAQVDDRPRVCLIDGEHTTAAVLRDFAWVRGVAHPDAVILFHDANVVWGALRRIVRDLRGRGAALMLDGVTFAVGLGEGAGVLADAGVREGATPAWRALLGYQGRAEVRRIAKRITPAPVWSFVRDRIAHT